MKYVQKKADIARTHRAVAEDLAKYGDNERKTLYVVYDPEHIVDEDTFLEPIRSRPGTMVRFIR